MSKIARVKFIRDKEPNIKALTAENKVLDGALYVATDTGTLWMGISSSSLIQIKDNINTNTTYNLTKSGSTITLRGSDGSTFNVTDSNTVYGNATASAAGLMSAADKAKLDGVAAGSNHVTVDAELSTTSTNPVQNKVIKSALDGKSNTGHTHDDRYYTKTEVNTKLDGKSNTGHKHVKADITDFPTSMPASDVYAWAKAASKPSYTIGEVSGNLAASRISGTISAANLPSYVDDVLEYASLSKFPTTGESGKIYTALDTNKIYRWSGSVYVVISETIALGTTHSSAGYGDESRAAYTHSTKTSGNPHHVTKADVGLGSVDNTSDANKSVKYAASAGYASSASKANGIVVSDARSENPAPSSNAFNKKMLTADFKFNSKIGSPTGFNGDYCGVLSLAPWADSSGGHGYQLAFGYEKEGHPRLALRGSDLSASSWDSWYKIYTSDDKPTLSELGAAAASHTHTKAQVGLSNVDNTADSDKSVKYAASAGSVAWSNVSGKPSSMPASDVYAWAKQPSKPSYTASEVGAAPASHSHSYLPLSGGTVSGNVHFASIGDKAKAAGITWDGSTDGASIYYETRGADSGHLVLNMTDDSSVTVDIAAAGAVKSYFDYYGTLHGNVDGCITRSGSGSWISARNNVVAYGKSTSSGNYNPVVGQKTVKGSWTIGNLASDERLVFSYDTDTNFNAGTNSSNTTYLPVGGNSQEIITSATIGSQSVSHANTAGSVAWSNVTGRPAIPSVGNGTVTITQNGTNKGSFTLNQSGNATIALTDTNTNTWRPEEVIVSSSQPNASTCKLWIKV